MKTKYGRVAIKEVSIRIEPVDKNKISRLDTHVIKLGLVRNGYAQFTSNELDYNQCESLLKEIIKQVRKVKK